MTLNLTVEPIKNALSILIEYPKNISNFSYNFEMHLTVFLQELPSFNFKSVYQHKFYVMKNSIKV